MKFSYQQAIRAVILFAFSAMLFKLHFTGDITKFINPKYVGLSQSASVIFLFLFFIQITRIWSVKEHNHEHCSHEADNCGHDHGNSAFNVKKLISYIIIIIPLLTGLFLPPKVLDSSIAANKGGMAVLTKQTSSEKETNNPATLDTNDDDTQSEVTFEHSAANPSITEAQKEISKEEFDQLIQKLVTTPVIEMNDYVFSSYYQEISKDINRFKGRNIELKGFVYKEDGFDENQLVLSRFLITHCVADASIIGLLSEFKEASSIEQDTWIEAKGVLDITNYNGMELPYIKISEWKKIKTPEEPYLYPISVRIL
ncbi:TIGR03943 family putative permease subunit [Bacillus solimangrovi]|uniref:TIGR03943 family protein n=1 Tax=Bacillus solimangrovi TaxID=1305675 RepID=A0A1E5LK59_9BACI|nr:TIGR03943 family protein [Bacillus solimangrovi]OEH94408.1 TIGR03943 family protein [Bacillus solimangrovi]